MAAGAPSAGQDVRRFYAGRLAEDEVYVFDRDGEVARLRAARAATSSTGSTSRRRRSVSGVGAALFRHVQELRPERFGFWVFSDNERARRFYESHGAWCVYETDGANNQERVADARYEWRPSREPAEA